MFEGWLYPLLASYLGHYVKGLQKDQVRPNDWSVALFARLTHTLTHTQLRVGLWNGVVQLENVELRLEVCTHARGCLSVNLSARSDSRSRLPRPSSTCSCPLPSCRPLWAS